MPLLRIWFDILEYTEKFIKRLFSVKDVDLPSRNVSQSHSFIKNGNKPFEWLVNVAPCFSVDAKSVKILTEPGEFYKTLLTNCRLAKKRIVLASLYLGNGPLEQQLLDSIRSNENYRNDKLRINILLDFTRGSRYKLNSRYMLLPLIKEHSAKLKVSLYHTPKLRGLLKKYLPNRVNELIGLQHMKVYIFDDTLIMSGANLSNDYFLNRQDRYFLIKDKFLCDFYCGLVGKVQDFSWKLDKDDNVSICDEWKLLSDDGDKKDFVQKASNQIKNYILETIDLQLKRDRINADTWIFPLVQMGQLNVNHDAQITDRIFAKSPNGSNLKITTGYFNLTKEYINTLIEKCQAHCDILMAHPQANGFLGAKGLAGGIPFAYSYIAKKFKKTYESKGHKCRFKLFEYLRNGWTYHGKGLWYYPPNKNVPTMTLIGSPNFGERSVKRDLESQLAVVTKNLEFAKRIDKERSKLYQFGVKADIERKVPVWINLFIVFFSSFF